MKTVCDRCGLVLTDKGVRFRSANFDSAIPHRHKNTYGKDGTIYALCDDCYEREKRKEPKTMKVKTIDMAREGMLLPPAPDVCQQCAVKHDPRAPHNQQSLFWQYWFYQKEGRWPTWADAMAHCTEEIKQATKDVLAQHGIKV